MAFETGNHGTWMAAARVQMNRWLPPKQGARLGLAPSLGDEESIPRPGSGAEEVRPALVDHASTLKVRWFFPTSHLPEEHEYGYDSSGR
jgi:hypothetical protein